MASSSKQLTLLCSEKNTWAMMFFIIVAAGCFSCNHLLYYDKGDDELPTLNKLPWNWVVSWPGLLTMMPIRCVGSSGIRVPIYWGLFDMWVPLVFGFPYILGFVPIGGPTRCAAAGAAAALRQLRPWRTFCSGASIRARLVWIAIFHGLVSAIVCHTRFGVQESFVLLALAFSRCSNPLMHLSRGNIRMTSNDHK